MAKQSSILTLDGPDLGQVVDPYEPYQPEPVTPAAPARPRKKQKKAAQPKAAAKHIPLPTNPNVGDCACRWNWRKQRWARLCFVGKGNGPGQSRSGWIVRGNGSTCEVTKK